MQKIELNFKCFGEGEPVLIFHGLLGMLDNWKSFARKLSTNYKVYIIDQRDHGRSPWTDTFNYDQLADDILDFMDQHEIDQSHLIGHSMGGKSVMRFVQKYPDRVKNSIIVDIGIRQYEAHHNEIFDALLSLNLEDVESRNDADEKLSLKIPDYGVRQFLMKNLTRKSEGGFKWKMNLSLLHESYQSITDSIGTEKSIQPTLFVYGLKSHYIKESDFESIQAIFPNATFEALDAGHWVHAEKPQELLDLVLLFLN